MGTETYRQCIPQYVKYHAHVKLNNPLMGTETKSKQLLEKAQGTSFC